MNCKLHTTIIKKMSRTVTIIGASGLVGSHLLELLLKDPGTDKVIALVRKNFTHNSPKLEQQIIDFQEPRAYEPHIASAEAVFVTVGTTNAKVDGDKDAYRKVDYDIPVYAAKAAAKLGVYGYYLVSAVGADANNNNNFYLKLKGVTEEAVSEEQIPQLYIMRPSLILGDRKERRIMEKAGQVVMPLFSWALGGSWSKYKPIQASEIAAAMFKAYTHGKKGIHVCSYEEMKALIKEY
jgi:uncharacterized protein YbjT (DUF2867 family)